MRLLTIDIGTNTVLGLTSEAQGGVLRPISDEMEIVRLGEGLDRTGRLSEAAMKRTISALARFGAKVGSDDAVAGRIDAAAAVATEATRKAENCGEFLARAEEALGFPVEVIDGHREAKLSWIATMRSLPPPRPPGDAAAVSGRRTVLDIGGGSTELIVGDAGRDEADEAVSVPIGSVRLTERLIACDPPDAEERQRLVEVVDAALQHAPRPEGDLVGIAGTVTTICAVHLGLEHYDASVVHGHRMSRADVEATVQRLGAIPIDERKRVPGCDPRRADVIYAGGVILCRVLARAGVDELIVSDRGIRWGLAYEIAERGLGRRLA